MLDRGITFEERYDNEEYGTTTFYFIAPKEMLERFSYSKGKFPEAEHMEISVECPTNCFEPRCASVTCSPSRYSEEEGGFTDYEWFDVELEYAEIEELIDIALKKNRMSRERLEELLYECMNWISTDNDNTMEAFFQIGFIDEEIEAMGFGYLVEEAAKW